jgi:hypothetical protein
MAGESSDFRLLRYSLVAVWLGTAFVSVVEWRGQSQDLLRGSELVPAGWSDGLIAAGVAVDLLLGLMLWLRPNRVTYGAALFVMSVMTALASFMQPSLWLHPLGPLLKNLPIAAALWVLAKGAR